MGQKRRKAALMMIVDLKMCGGGGAGRARVRWVENTSERLTSLARGLSGEEP
jgi:hypothetical protein